jgi:hypothetical protein
MSGLNEDWGFPDNRSQAKYDRRREVSGPPEDSHLRQRVSL